MARQHPSESYTKLSKRFGVPATTIRNRYSGTHAARGENTARHLSIIQEDTLIGSINAYADRGTLLTPKHVQQLAIRLCNHKLGRNWTSSFLHRHKDRVSSRFYKIQELARLKADTPETRKVFLTLVAEVLDTGLYLPRNIYNMDECGFDLSATRRTRRVGPRNASIKAQTSLSTITHITVIAAISTQDAPVPPFLIYPGKYSMSDCFAIMDNQPKQMAVTMESGNSNTYMTICWLTDCFDPATKPRAAGSLRLLFLDGPDIHTSVNFLDACWARKIVCIILPANMSSVFQPLDVDFFAHVKRECHRQIDDYQQGSGAVSVPKSFFYRWHQRAWAKAANSRQIRSAWAKAHLFPRAAVTTGIGGLAIPPTGSQPIPKTPQCNRTLHTLDLRVQSGDISPTSSARKVRKALEEVLAQNVLLLRDKETREGAAELDRKGRSRGKRTRYPLGFLFDQQYEEDHAEELAERRREEKGKKQARKAGPGAIPHAESSNSAQRRAKAVSTDPQNLETLASIADEI